MSYILNPYESEANIIPKMEKVNDKEKNLKKHKRKKVTYKGAPIRLSADFSMETFQARGIDMKYSK